MILLKSLKLVKAGRAGTVLPTNTKEVDVARWQKWEPEIRNKQMYCVIGESMSPEGIHTDNILVASEILPTARVQDELKYGTFIILQIPDEKNTIIASKKANLKMRKFLMELDIRKSAEELWEEVQSKDRFSCGEDAKKLFIRKHTEALRRISEDDERKDVLLSITYTAEHGREYSFHSRKMLCAKVDFYIDNNNEKQEIQY